MTVQSNHHSARLRFETPQGETIKTLHRVRPNINANQVELIMDAIEMIRASAVGGAFLTVTTELSAGA